MHLGIQPDYEDSLSSGKSSSAFRTIGEVAVELGLPKHVLRFWESKFNQIKPHKRRGGHRYYRPADIEILREIKSLLYERGYTIKGAQKHLKDVRKDVALASDQSSLFIEAPAAATSAQPTIDKINLEHRKQLKRLLSELIEIRKMLN